MGGTTFQRGASGTLIRVRPLPTRRRTTYTNAERGHWQYLSRLWRELTPTQRADWQTQADALTWTNKFGEVIAGKGYWLYLAVNGYYQLLTGTINPIAGVVAAVSAVTGLSSASNVAMGSFNLTWSSGAVPVGESFLVYTTPPLSGGRSAGFARYRYVCTIGSGGTSPNDISTQYGNRWGALPAAGQNVFVRVLPVVTSWGLPGVPVEVLNVAS